MHKDIINLIADNPKSILVIIAALITGLFGLIMYRKNRVRPYRKILFDAIQPELDKILHTDEDCRIILDDIAYSKHKTAINNLISQTDFIERIRLKRKWKILTTTKFNKKTIHTTCYEQYADYGSLKKRREMRPIIIKRLQGIVSFTNK